MGGILKGNNGNGNGNGGGSNGNHKGRPYALMILLAFGAAFTAIMVLHKFRERRVIAMITAEKDQQLIALHSLLQTSQLLHEKAKKKILHIKERHRIERKELLSTISGLKEEREKLYMELEENNSELKTLREHEANSGRESSQAAALGEILKQKEAEIENLKNQIENLARVRSVSTEDPSIQSKTLTRTDVLDQNREESQSTEHDHSANLSERSENESSSHEDNNLSTNGEALALETVHLVGKTVATEKPDTFEGVNDVGSKEPDAQKERSIDENQAKDNGESQDEREPAIAQENSTGAQKTSNEAVNAPVLNSQQEGQGIENVQRRESNPARIDRIGRISHTRRHRRHRIKRLKDYLRNRQMGEQTETREQEVAEKRISMDDTVETQQNNTVGSDVQKSNVIDDHGEEVAKKNEIGGQDTQLPLSNEFSKDTEKQIGESAAEKAQDTDTPAFISSSMKLQETQKQDDRNEARGQEAQLPVSNEQSKEIGNQTGEIAAENELETNITSSMKLQETRDSEEQTDSVGTEKKENPNAEQQAVANTEKENVEVSMSITDNKQNTDQSKQTEEEEHQQNLATPESKDSNSKENTIEQVTEREEIEDDDDPETGSSELDAATEISTIDSKSKQAETKEDAGEEETEF